MKIIEENNEVLILKDSGTVFRLIGALFIVLGIFFFIKSIAESETVSSLFSILVSLVGASVVVFVKDTTTTMNRTLGTIQITKKNMVGSGLTEYRFSDIQNVLLRIQMNRDTKTNRQTVTSQLALDTTTNGIVPLEMMAGGISERTDARRQIGQKIADLLQVPFQDGSLKTNQTIWN